MCTRDIFPFNQTEEDEEFLEFLSELQENDLLIPLNILIDQNKSFTPFELNEDLNLPLIDSDPDVQFYNNQCNNSLHSCDYYLEDSFNNKVSDLNLSTGCLSMVHMNIRSIVKNLNEFDLYLNDLNHEFPIIALSETWLKDHNCDRYGIDVIMLNITVDQIEEAVVFHFISKRLLNTQYEMIFVSRITS